MKEFIAFYRAYLLCASRGDTRSLFRKTSGQLFVPFICIMIVSGTASLFGFMLGYPVLMWMGLTVSLTQLLRQKPNLVTLMPLSHAKKTLFTFLAILVNVVIFLLIMAVVVGVIILFDMFMLYMQFGASIFEPSLPDMEPVPDVDFVWSKGETLMVFQILFYCMLTMGWTALESKKKFWIFSGVFLAVSEAMVVLLKIIMFNSITGNSLLGMEYGDLSSFIDIILLADFMPWIDWLIALYAIASVLALAWSVWVIYRRYQPKKY